MKKFTFLSAALLFFISQASAQWTQLNYNSIFFSLGIEDFSVVDQNVMWATNYDASGLGNYNRTFIVTTDGGASFTGRQITLASSLGKEFANVSAISGSTAWFSLYNPSSGGGVIFKTTDGGFTFVQQNTPVLAWLNFVHFFDANNGVAMSDPAGTDFQIITTSNGGATWTLLPGQNIPDALNGDFGIVNTFSARGNDIWFATQLGEVYHSANKGLNWTKSASGLSAAGSASAINLIEFQNSTTGMVTRGAVIRKTTDGGNTWFPISPAGPIHSYDISYVPGTIATYVSSGGAQGDLGTSYSTDGGQTWIALDQAQHTEVEFYDVTTGWLGGFTNTSGVGGIFKYTGAPFVTALPEEQALQPLTIYPNPSTGRVFLQMPAQQFEAVLSVYNQLGQLLLTRQASSGVTQELNLEQLPGGIYLLTITTEQATWSRALLLER